MIWFADDATEEEPHRRTVWIFSLIKFLRPWEICCLAIASRRSIVREAPITTLERCQRIS